MHVSVIGAGYVGLVTAACFADVGNVVLCVDIDPHKVEKLKRRNSDSRTGSGAARRAQRSCWSTTLFNSYDDAVSHATLILIAVGTPRAKMARPICRMSSLVRESLAGASSAIRDCGQVHRAVGTNDQVRSALQSEVTGRRRQVRVTTASNPEFLKEGFAVEDFMKPDRIIVGVDDSQSQK